MSTPHTYDPATETVLPLALVAEQDQQVRELTEALGRLRRKASRLVDATEHVPSPEGLDRALARAAWQDLNTELRGAGEPEATDAEESDADAARRFARRVIALEHTAAVGYVAGTHDLLALEQAVAVRKALLAGER